MNIPKEIKMKAVRELPLDCKGQTKCSKMPFFQIECSCECYKENLEKLMDKVISGRQPLDICS
jgi:hypothetical protein